MPFLLAGNDWIEADGTWGSKQTYKYFNNWCPAILQCLWANHDIKLITNRIETKDIAWHITHYVAKKQRDSLNTSALLAKMFAYHHWSEHWNFDLVTRNKKLIQQCANTLSCEQEISATEVVSCLMGWGNCYISHHFETIPWFSVLSLLQKTFSVLNQPRWILYYTTTELIMARIRSHDLQSESPHSSEVTVAQEVSYHFSGIILTYMISQKQIDNLVTLEIVQGQLQIKDQALEYIDRGDALECWSYLDFFLGTYNGPLLKEHQSNQGQTPNTRVPYWESTNQQGHCQIIRSAGHEMMPHFPGQWFPKREEENSNDLSEVSMLALLKP